MWAPWEVGTIQCCKIKIQNKVNNEIIANILWYPKLNVVVIVVVVLCCPNVIVGGKGSGKDGKQSLLL